MRWSKSSFGWPLVLSLYLFCTVRIMIPVELPQAYILGSRQLYPFIMRLLSSQIPLGLHDAISVSQALLILWGFVSAILLTQFLFNYVRALRSITKYAESCSPKENDSLNKVMTKSRMRVAILYRPNLETPFGVGILKRRILLPKRDYTEEELRYILLHECTHFMHNDILLKLLVSVFCIIFWWNPVVYLLKRDMEHTLEAKCDIAVAKRLSNKEKAAYLKSLLRF